MLSSILTLLALGCLTGVTTVVFGFGGGFVTVPVVYAFTLARAEPGVDAMAVAVATSTAVMVVNSVSATWAQYRSGRLRRVHLWPLALYIGLGSAAGALVATAAGGSVQYALFVVYLVVTIADSLLRKGFLTRSPGAAPGPPRPGTTRVVGLGIGAVTGFLGVGGSVMTVPLLRRRGLPMGEATAMANPLTVPVALAGTLVYALWGTGGAGADQGHLGSVDLVAGALLLAGSLPTIALVRRYAGRIPDRAHAVSYVVLLTVVLAVFLLLP
ncbi:sulfite exporter TauE/SafE family protein [Nocardiopsis ganjiahuensis]|uniref:sulfite exporter TauE/SafE family protein n=1 Tax=Nocardiopsis ganjiahuensis TaxID=239984 RepID=UPI0004770DFB|nr:sulfite exporter TauE/SafE family protein [Nocardiopsis ganjiahuensis]